MKPFVKWAGGKSQLLLAIEQRLPKTINDYYEPFVGGGALVLNKSHYFTNHIYLNDLSKNLIITYKIIKEKPEYLMKLLDKHERCHAKNPKEYYLKTRLRDRDQNWKYNNNPNKAAWFIYLNKVAFNGLYRVNSQGFFNVPWNQKSVIKTYDPENILKINNFLSQDRVKVTNHDFEKVVESAKRGDFVFFDPPYDYLNKNTFDSYNSERFGVDGQVRLANLAKKLKSRGVNVMITNHDTDLIRKLYAPSEGFRIETIPVKRSINANPNKRNGKEVIIRSYDA